MHEKFEDLLLLYTTNSISAEQRHDLQAHLAQCSQCRQSLNEWRAIADAVKARALEKEYLQEQAHMTTRLIPMQRRERPLAMALALVAIMCIVVILFANRPSLPNIAPQIALQSTPIIYVDIVIAARPIENGAVIHEDDVMIYTIPLANARFFSMRTVDEVVNTIARRNIVCGHQILQTDLVENARDVPDTQVAFREEAYSCPEGALEPLTEPIDYIDVVIAERLMEVGHIVQAEDVATIPYPAQLLSSDIILNLEAIVVHTTLKSFQHVHQRRA
jgi:flagella basal body P-ring formation protein FlgA